MVVLPRRISFQMRIDEIVSPKDIKPLDIEQLSNLCQDIRERIISIVSKRGGHLASSLGAVELAVSIHYVYDAPKDKIIWDVGHQAYAHKLLTGRARNFDTLRCYGGISGFPSHFESEYDPFTVGHSSTAVSLAMGMAVARDLNGDDYNVLAIIGDGSLSGGMCFEALNHAGHSGTDILVILNSNNMAISPVQGALSNYVNRIISADAYNRIHNKIRDALLRLPAGKSIARIGARLEEALKGLIIPGWLFEELGFRYFGPIDGHNIDLLIQTLKRIRPLPGPKLLHVVTQKGKGYKFAEKQPTLFHGIGNFDIDTGKVEKRGGKTFTNAFSDVMLEIFKKDKDVVAITAAMLDGTGLRPLRERFPERVFDVGIAEEHAVTFSAGLARAGKIPVVAIYSTFLQRSYDQMVNDVALQDVGVVFAIDRAGLVGRDGIMHHGLLDICYLRPIPKMQLLAPRDETMMHSCFRWAIEKARRDKVPVALRYPRAELPPDEISPIHSIVEHTGQIVYDRDGAKVAAFCVGPLVYDVYNIVKENDLPVRVVDVLFLAPMNIDWLISAAEGVEKIVVFEEGYLRGGFGEAVRAELRHFEVDCIAVENEFILHGSREELLCQVGLGYEQIKERLFDAVEGA